MNSWIAPPWATPALLNSTSAAPKCANAASASASRSPGAVTSVRTANAGVPAGGELAREPLGGRELDVGEHHAHPLLGARARDPRADAARRPRHHRHASRQIFHGETSTDRSPARRIMLSAVDEPLRVFVTREIPEVALRRLAEGLPGARIDVHRGRRARSRRARSREPRAARVALVCTLADRIDAALLAALAPPLRVVATFAVGHENIDLDAARRLGVRVANTPGVLTDATAEIAVALALACARRVVEGDRFVRAGRFAGWGPLAHRGHAVYGAHGRHRRRGPDRLPRRRDAAARLRLRDPRALAQRPRRAPDWQRELGARFVPLDELLERSDIVSLHCPLSPRDAPPDRRRARSRA